MKFAGGKSSAKDYRKWGKATDVKQFVLQELFGILAFALGGAAGSKTARQIGLKISGETLLRRIRRTSILVDKPVKVLGVEQDRAPVETVFKSSWSQGQVEGQVNRLKFLKRQMYGRANFDLLRARVVCGS